MIIQTRFLQHALTKIAGWLSQSQWGIIKTPFIQLFIKHYRVDLHDALIEDPTQYPSFEAFFTRKLKDNARPLPTSPQAIASPADGTIACLGDIGEHTPLLAKGHHYSLDDLLGNKETAAPFQGGQYLTVYLAPHNYHRVHMPVSGRLTHMRYIPGSLFPVNQEACAEVDGLFAKNERVICTFDTEHGPMVLVFVGAMIVGSVVTDWHGPVTAPSITDWSYDDTPLYKRGADIGAFTLGSTVIALWPKEASIAWQMNAADLIKQGQLVGSFETATD